MLGGLLRLHRLAESNGDGDPVSIDHPIAGTPGTRSPAVMIPIRFKGSAPEMEIMAPAPDLTPRFKPR